MSTGESQTQDVTHSTAHPRVGGGEPRRDCPADSASVSNFVERWGSLADIPGVTFQKLLSPTPARLPGQVAEVATSNSTYYALLTNGSVYAFGMGNKGQLGNGRSRTPPTRRCTCASRPG